MQGRGGEKERKREKEREFQQAAHSLPPLPLLNGRSGVAAIPPCLREQRKDWREKLKRTGSSHSIQMCERHDKPYTKIGTECKGRAGGRGEGRSRVREGEKTGGWRMRQLRCNSTLPCHHCPAAVLISLSLFVSASLSLSLCLCLYLSFCVSVSLPLCVCVCLSLSSLVYP